MRPNWAAQGLSVETRIAAPAPYATFSAPPPQRGPWYAQNARNATRATARRTQRAQASRAEHNYLVLPVSHLDLSSKVVLPWFPARTEAKRKTQAPCTGCRGTARRASTHTARKPPPPPPPTPPHATATAGEKSAPRGLSRPLLPHARPPRSTGPCHARFSTFLKACERGHGRRPARSNTAPRPTIGRRSCAAPRAPRRMGARAPRPCTPLRSPAI